MELDWIILCKAVVVFLTAAFATKYLIKSTQKLKLIDNACYRSSHVGAKPTGGGAVFIPFMLLLILLMHHDMPKQTAYILLAGGMVIAVVSFIDDIKGLSALFRICIQFLVAFTTVLAFKESASQTISLFYYSAALFFILWMINLYNFMDGIDGLAGTQAIFICLCGMILAFLHKINIAAEIWLYFIAILLGFLVYNWAPSKIFMGDVGSATLGFFFACIALYTMIHHDVSIVTWLIIFSAFLFDATFTLSKRLIRGEKLYQAHNSHLYQQMARKLNSHAKVCIIYQVLNILVTLPCALISVYFSNYQYYCLLIALIPYIIIALTMDLKISKTNPTMAEN